MGFKLKLAILDNYQQVAQKMADWTSLSEMAEVISFDRHMSDRETLVKKLKSFDIISTMRERTLFDRELISRLPRLKLLTTTGMHNASIDLDAATDFGITVCGTSAPVTPGAPIDMSDVVELTWGLILGLARYIPREDRQMRLGQWQTAVGISLKGKNLGILGLGNLGLKVAEIGKAFGMNILAWSMNMTKEKAQQHGVTYTRKDDFFAKSDVISIHLKLSERTKSLIGRKELGLMKQSALLINTARGPIIDEQALLEALKTDQICGAGLDVFSREPLPMDHPFLSLPNVILTPHIGYVAEKTYREFYSETVEDIQAYLQGKPLRVLNPEVFKNSDPKKWIV